MGVWKHDRTYKHVNYGNTDQNKWYLSFTKGNAETENTKKT